MGRVVSGNFQSGPAHESSDSFPDWSTIRAEIDQEQREDRQGREKKVVETEAVGTGTGAELVEEPEDSCEVEGELPPLLEQGERVMVCVAYRLVRVVHGLKDVLSWLDEGDLVLLHQYFNHYLRYPIHSKAVTNWLTAMGIRPKRFDRLSLRNLVGLRCKVYVETVKPSFEDGALKGTQKPEVHFYSKVAEILAPGDRVAIDPLADMVLNFRKLHEDLKR